METSLIALALAYVLLLLLLVMTLLRSDIATSLKAVLVILVSVFYIWHYTGLQALRGWPAQQRLPANFEMIARVVVEPNLQQDETGGIYLWLRDLEQDAFEPRAFRLPYDRNTHREVDDALKKQQQGQRLVGRPAQEGNTGARGAIDFEPVKRDRGSLKPGSQ